SIGDYAFYDCSSLKNVTIGRSVTSIGNYAFASDTNLTQVNYNADSCILVGTGIFSGCSNIKTLHIGNNVKMIPTKIFIFRNFQKLDSLIIGNSVKTIEDSIFKGCTNLRSVTIGNSVTSIGVDAFYGCNSLIRANYTGTIGQWCNIDFGNSFANPITYSQNLNINNQRVSYLNIQNMNNTIKPYAFYNCKGLNSVTISDSVSQIGDSAFYGCTGLTKTDYMGTIEQWMRIDFKDCYANPITYSRYLNINNIRITNIDIPNTIDTIKPYVFYNCSLNSIIFRRANTIVDTNAFKGVSKSTSIQIPCGSSSWYASQLVGFYNLREITPYIYTVQTQNSTMGFVQTQTTPTCNNSNTLTFSATAYNDSAYVFTHWSDGDSNSQRTIMLTQDTALVANFSPWYRFTVKNAVGGYVSIASRPTMYNPQAVISATARQGFHFAKWSDGDTTNPRTLTIERDTNLTALFDTNTHYVSFAVNDTTLGRITGATNGMYKYFTRITVSAQANYGYHFTKWSNGYTSNPLTIVVYGDLNFSAIFDTNTYSITLTAQDDTMGTVKGSGTYKYLSTANLFADAKYDYRFIAWSDGDTNARRTMVVERDSSLVARFSKWYNFFVYPEDTAKGLVQVLTPPSQSNPQATFVAYPNAGYEFDHWSDGNTQNPRSLTVTKDTTVLVAYFSVSVPQRYSFVVVSEDTSKGTVQIITQPTQSNPQATFVALPQTGYMFERWSDGNTQNPRTLTVTQDTILIAYFTTPPAQWYNFSVLSEDTNKGTVQIVTQPTQSNPQATIVAIPGIGYVFDHWSDGNTQNPRTLTVTQDSVLIAFFASSSQQWYNFVVLSQDTAKGSVQVLTQPTYSNPQATFVALPQTGYMFERWSDGNTQNPRSLTVTQDTILIAYFTISTQWYNFSVVSEDTSKGTVQIVTQPTQANPQSTIVALPNTGYEFSRWSDGNTQNPRTLTITQDSVLIAYFTASVQQWYNFVVLSQDTAKGFVRVLSQPTKDNPQAIFVATPQTGYMFEQWSDGNTQNPRTLTVTQDTILVAYFAPSSQPWQNFIVVSENINKGTIQMILQPTQDNPQAIFKALPNMGYEFSHWSDGDTQSYRSLMVTQDSILIAYFNPKFVRSIDTNQGNIQMLKQPTPENPEAIVYAMPKPGYVFSHWEDRIAGQPVHKDGDYNTDNPRTVIYTEDLLLIAHWVPETSIKNAKLSEEMIKVFPNPAKEQFTISGLEQPTNIQLVNTIGQVVKRFDNVTESIIVDVSDLSKGIYFVKVGNRIRKLVVE
ncbi:MAG: leucine-rich repeat domain-containing protein, partial [Bacteroidales bacterium]|nr:leucine-rich repeat domain-containing protein [Bacteroidales bacterium]